MEVCMLGLWLTRMKIVKIVKIHFASKVSMFQQCLIYQKSIVMCYNCQTKAWANKIPCGMTWAIIEAICETFVPIVAACVVIQCHGYWLLLDVLVSTIKSYVRLEKEKLDM